MINLTIDGTNKRIKIDYLKTDGTTVTGTDYLIAANICRLRDELDGWWFDRVYQTDFDRKVLFADIVLYNASPIGATTQAQITTALLAILPPA
jgi:hypothetical protein